MTEANPQRMFGRSARLNAAGLLVRDGERGLDFSFRVQKTTKVDPNEATIVIRGLNSEHRALLGSKEGLPVQLEAGYAGGLGLIFLGVLRRIHSTLDPFWQTTVEAMDGDISTKRVCQSFGGRVALTTVIRTAAKALGVGIGNLEEALSAHRALRVSDFFENGTALSGQAAEELSRLLEMVGLEWSIQDGELQLLERGKPLDSTAVLLSPQSGLVGSPTIQTRDKDKQYVLAKSLMNPALRPGGLCRVQSKALEATFRIERAIYGGETNGQSWYVDVEGRLQT